MREISGYVAALLEAMFECVMTLDRNGTVLEMNRAGLDLMEAETPEDVVGKCIYALVDEPRREAFRAVIEGVFRGRSGGALEFSIIGFKGARRVLESRVVPLRDEDGNVIGALAAMRDITRQRELEQRAFHASKLEGVGLLAGGIAHDFNKLLTGILGNASLLQTEIPAHSPLYPAIEMIAKAAQRSSELTRQMLVYSGRARFEFETVDVAEKAREILTLIEPSIPRHVHLAVDLENSDCLIEGDGGQIQAILMNLMINAAEATVSEGVVSVSVRRVAIASPRATLTGDLAAGDYVALEIGDSGPEIDADTRRTMFEPFVGTKFTGRLGLPAIRDTLRRHKGVIDLESAPGRSNRLILYFPASPVKPKRAVDPPRARVRTGAVLLVDDEDIVRQTGRLTLEKLGFQVLLAGSGSEAVEQFRSHHAEVALVILDLTMPGLSGNEALQQLKDIDSSVPVLGTSSFSAHEARDRFGEAITGFIAKPYTFESFSDSVLDAVASRS